MNDRSAGTSAHRNRAVRRVVVVAQVVAVDKAEAVLVVLVVKVVVVQVVREAKEEAADVQVANAVRHRAKHRVSKSRHRNKTPRLLVHGVCGSG
jgi:translation initiation factor 2 gamma subunit (eIF-2gamma)